MTINSWIYTLVRIYGNSLENKASKKYPPGMNHSLHLTSSSPVSASCLLWHNAWVPISMGTDKYRCFEVKAQCESSSSTATDFSMQT